MTGWGMMSSHVSAVRSSSPTPRPWNSRRPEKKLVLPTCACMVKSWDGYCHAQWHAPINLQPSRVFSPYPFSPSSRIFELVSPHLVPPQFRPVSSSGSLHLFCPVIFLSIPLLHPRLSPFRLSLLFPLPTPLHSTRRISLLFSRPSSFISICSSSQDFGYMFNKEATAITATFWHPLPNVPSRARALS